MLAMPYIGPAATIQIMRLSERPMPISEGPRDGGEMAEDGGKMLWPSTSELVLVGPDHQLDPVPGAELCH
jgi:hypothetical protein